MAVALMVMPTHHGVHPVGGSAVRLLRRLLHLLRALPRDVPRPRAGAGPPAVAGVQNAAREIGLGMALVGGGFLLSVWKGLPFVLSAIVLLLVTIAFVSAAALLRAATARRTTPRGPRPPSSPSRWRSWALIQEKADIRRLLSATVLWELALGAASRPSSSCSSRSAWAGRPRWPPRRWPIVAVGVVAAALAAGPLAERFGHRRLLTGRGRRLRRRPRASRSSSTACCFLIAMLPLAFAAGIVMTLPYSLLMGLLPRRTTTARAPARSRPARGLGVGARPDPRRRRGGDAAAGLRVHGRATRRCSWSPAWRCSSPCRSRGAGRSPRKRR